MALDLISEGTLFLGGHHLVDLTSNTKENMSGTTTNAACLLEEQPELKSADNLHAEFLEAMHLYPTAAQLFELIEKWQNLCGDHSKLLRRLQGGTSENSSQFKDLRQLQVQLENEEYTWALMASLLRDRADSAARMEMEDAEVEAMDVGEVDRTRLSERQVIAMLYDRESAVREAQLVVDWLEDMYKPELETAWKRNPLSNSRGWENTLHQLRSGSGGGRLVGSLDPDAPLRESGKMLADLDREDERRLLRFLFMCVRAGELDRAIEICINHGCSWRAATLEGWRPYHDPNRQECSASGRRPVEGNPKRSLWKKAALGLCRDPGMPAYERAVYAAYCGDIQSLLPVCESWEDLLWAHFKTSLENRVEQEVSTMVIPRGAGVSSGHESWTRPLSAAALLAEVEAAARGKSDSQARGLFSLVQQRIIMGELEQLSEDVYQHCKKVDKNITRHEHRFLVHLALVLRRLECESSTALTDQVLEWYTWRLVEEKCETQLVAGYTSFLPHEPQVQVFSVFLENVTVFEERKQCLEIAASAGLDVTHIIETVVNNIRHKTTSAEPGGGSTGGDSVLEAAPLSADDRAKIEAMDWLLFDDALRAEAVRQACAVARLFLVLRKPRGAAEVLHKLPSDSIRVVRRNYQAATGDPELSMKLANSVREMMCLDAYVEAQEAYADWFKHYYHAAPQCPSDATDGPPQPLNFAERVAREHRQKEFEEARAQWQHLLDLSTKTAVRKLYNILLFPLPGWLVDEVDPLEHLEEEQDSPEQQEAKSRQQQMVVLRKLCIPDVVFLLLKVLLAAGDPADCLRLADTVADEERGLCHLFRKDQLRLFMTQLHTPAVRLLDSNRDPLGYPLHQRPASSN